jgi:curved DNA-binding protein CbpA
VAAEDSALSTTEKATLDRLHIVVQSGDHYEILGVEDAAERMDIQQAYYTLSRQWHPDRFFRVDLGEYTDRLETVFIAITEAYRVLSNDAAARLRRPERVQGRPASALEAQQDAFRAHVRAAPGSGGGRFRTIPTPLQSSRRSGCRPSKGEWGQATATPLKPGEGEPEWPHAGHEQSDRRHAQEPSGAASPCP